MDGKDSAPIIIKKINKGGHGGSHGAWKVAYADFVTAMMALFIVLWILSSSEKTKKAVAHYFQDPGGSISIGSGGSIIASGGANPANPSAISNEGLKQIERKKLQTMGNEIVARLKKGDDFRDVMSQIDVQVTDEGLRIEIMESNRDVFFEVGNAGLKPKADHILREIGSQLSKINNSLSIEGHTDARPYAGGLKGYSNYELSAERASAARRSLISGGLQETKISDIRGYAANRLRNKANPLDVVNRRISILVKYNEK